MPRANRFLDVHWVHARPKGWDISGYIMRANPDVRDGSIGVLIDHAIINSDLRYAYRPAIAILHEPRAKFGHLYEAVYALQHEFAAILTHDAQLLKLPSAYLLPVGGLRVRSSGVVAKTKQLVMIASWKADPERLSELAWAPNSLDGHVARWHAAHVCLRHGVEVYGSMGHGVTEIGPALADKTRVLAPAQFSIEAECHKADNWFTEKLLDCLALRTVPIYYGPDNIGDFFDTRGMLLWSHWNKIGDIIDQIRDGQIKYEDFMPYILTNQELAMQYSNTPKLYSQAITDVLERRTVYIDIHDTSARKRLFWHCDGYDLRMNPQECTGDIGVFWDRKVHDAAKRNAYKTRFAVLHEPRLKQPRSYQYVKATRDAWTGIFTHDPDLLGGAGVYLGLAANTWAGPSGEEALGPHGRHEKPVLITMINSSKAHPMSELDGYRMRFAAMQELTRRGIIVYGTGGAAPTPPGHCAHSKMTVLAPAQFSVEAECHKRDNWFTEKLIDCFMAMTVPIYYGPDNITKFFRDECMLRWNTIEELREILDCVESGQIKYKDFLPALAHARATAMRFTYPPKRHLDKIVELWEAL